MRVPRGDVAGFTSVHSWLRCHITGGNFDADIFQDLFQILFSALSTPIRRSRTLRSPLSALPATAPDEQLAATLATDSNFVTDPEAAAASPLVGRTSAGLT